MYKINTINALNENKDLGPNTWNRYGFTLIAFESFEFLLRSLPKYEPFPGTIVPKGW